MIDNFETIKSLLTFDSKKENFYFVQVIQRKKDYTGSQKVSGTNNNSRLVKAYYVDSVEYFNFIKDEIIKLCELFNARAGINLNRRNYKKAALQHLKKCTDKILNEDYKAHKAYPSVVGKYSHDSDKKWIIDFDYLVSHEEIEELRVFLYNLEPLGDKIISIIPSKSGVHVITSPFNIAKYNESAWRIEEVHKNNPTNLYIPY